MLFDSATFSSKLPHELKDLTRLEYLYVYDLASDAALADIKNLANLKVLKLTGGNLSDAGLQFLTGLTKLALLDLRDTHVTEAGVGDLQRALPNSKILYGTSHR